MRASTRYGNTDFVMFLRAIAINALGAAVAFWAYRAGWIAAIIEADTVYISRTIAGLGLLGLGMITVRIFKVSHELNIARKYHKLVKEDTGKHGADLWLESSNSRVAEFVHFYRGALDSDKPVLVDQFKATMGSKLSIFVAITEWLVILGFVGTVVGMRMGVGAIDPAAFRNFELLAPLIKKIIGAFYVAFDTTIVGACMALWLDMNLKWVLRPGMVQLINESVNIGVINHG